MEEAQNYFEASIKEKNSQYSETLSNLFNRQKRIDQVLFILMYKNSLIDSTLKFFNVKIYQNNLDKSEKDKF